MKCLVLSPGQDASAFAPLQENFRRHALPHWDLEPFPVPAGGDLLRAWQTWCAGQALAHKPVMILTADARFGPHTCATIENSVAHLAKGGGFDLLFPDLRLLQAGAMADLFVLRRQLMTHGRTRLIDPRPLGFEAPGACIVHPSAVLRLPVLSVAASVSHLMEEVFCQPVREGKLIGRFVFPFATMVTSGDDGHVPSDPETRTTIIGDIFRRMVWRDGGCEPELAPLAQISKGLSTEAKAFAILWAAMAD